MKREVKVMWDWESTGLWSNEPGIGFLDEEYENVPMSPGLAERMKHWCDWIQSQNSSNLSGFDWNHFDAYGMNIAIDLRQELDESWVVLYHDDDGVIVVK